MEPANEAAPSAAPITAASITVESIAATDALAAHLDAWRALVPHALEQNLNVEPEPLLASLRHVDDDGVRTLLFRDGDRLVGVWPIRLRRALPVPLAQWCCYHHGHLMACTPLLHAERVDACLEAFLDWLDAAREPSLFTIDEAVDRSALWDRLLARLVARGRRVERVDRTARPALTELSTAPADYPARAMGAKQRGGDRRKRRGLEALGDWRVDGRVGAHRLGDAGARTDALLEELLTLEAAGWKGRAGTAIAQVASTRAFVDAVVRYSEDRDRLLLLVARAGNRPVAAQLGLINDGEVLLYKSGYDETLGRFSPGKLLLMDAAQACLTAGLCIDSCAGPDAAFYAQCLADERTIAKYRFASAHRTARTTLALVAGARRTVMRWRGRHGLRAPRHSSMRVAATNGTPSASIRNTG